MTKIKTPKQKKRDSMKEDVFAEWKKLQKRGHNKKSALPILSDIFVQSESTLSKWIVEMEKKHGERPHADAMEKIRKEVYEDYISMKDEGITNDEAFHTIGSARNKSFATIRNWVMRERKMQQQ